MSDGISSGRHVPWLAAGGVFCLAMAGLLTMAFLNDFGLQPPEAFRSEVMDVRAAREGVMIEPITTNASSVIISWQTADPVRP